MHKFLSKSTALSAAALAGIACLGMAQVAQAQTIPPYYYPCNYWDGFEGEMPSISQTGNNQVNVQEEMGQDGSGFPVSVHIWGQETNGAFYDFIIWQADTSDCGNELGAADNCDGEAASNLVNAGYYNVKQEWANFTCPAPGSPNPACATMTDYVNGVCKPPGSNYYNNISNACGQAVAQQDYMDCCNQYGGCFTQGG